MGKRSDAADVGPEKTTLKCFFAKMKRQNMYYVTKVVIWKELWRQGHSETTFTLILNRLIFFQRDSIKVEMNPVNKKKKKMEDEKVNQINTDAQKEQQKSMLSLKVLTMWEMADFVLISQPTK